MGNTAGKEVRPRSNTYSSTSSTLNSYDINRRNTIFGNVNDYKKSRKQEERDRQREDHYSKLIVKYDETVDGGYLAPFGTYKSNLDFNVDIVRELIIQRKLAPFYTPLQDFDEDWTEDELLKILSQLTLHSIEIAYDDEEIDDIDDHKIHKSSNFYKRQEQKMKLKLLMEKIKSLQKDEENKFFDVKLEGNDDNLPSKDLLLKLYKNPIECPICFLYYPNNLNLSRCCLQPICTECFVQIKRLDPHPPHDQQNQSQDNELPHTIISEPSNCPYCAMNDFGVIFEKELDIKTGIGGIKPGIYHEKLVHDPIQDNIEDIKQDLKNLSVENTEVFSSSPSSSPMKPSPIKKESLTEKRRRRSSIPANSPKVITIDQIRPDWELKLANAKSKLARKAAAASAIHASNLIINPSTDLAEYDTRRRNSNTSRFQTIEDRMIEEALRLSIIDEEERVRRQGTPQSESSNNT